MTTRTIPLARQGVFLTVQGEGILSGLPMVFVRLAGCSVGCAGCDTDYALHARRTPEDLGEMVAEAARMGLAEWCWVTGGEPTDHNLRPVCEAARAVGLRVALATAGVRPVPRRGDGGPDFLSVSPHALGGWVQREGDQVNLVPGLNGLSWEDADAIADQCGGFRHRYLTPMADREGRPQELARCVQWVYARRGWRLGSQNHKGWSLP